MRRTLFATAVIMSFGTTVYAAPVWADEATGAGWSVPAGLYQAGKDSQAPGWSQTTAAAFAAGGVSPDLGDVTLKSHGHP